jgi:glycosyltransferase involved in cell wall biosynthesis
MKSLILFYRKPVPHFFSIEKIFDAIALTLPKELSVQKRHVPHHTSSIKKILLNLRFVKRQKADVYHVTGDVHYAVMALPKSRTILTIHDCVFLYQYSGIKRWFFHRLLLKWPVKHCSIVTTISEQTKKDIIRFTGCSADKIRVINNPLTEAIHYKPKSFNSELPVLLFLGSTPNKNLPRIIEAVKDIPCVLEIVGIIPEEQEKMLRQYNIKFNQSSRLSEQELAEKYVSCDLLLFPTLFEGFGLPIIEAQKAGRPVLTSKLSPMQEVAGGAACLVNPEDVQSIRQGIFKIMNDEGYREQLVKDGFENIKRFEPQAIAQQYYSLYKEVAEQ